MDGIIIINKPKQYTSHDIVAKVKKILNTKKVGHTGTLDPNATGVLPILLGQGTKLSKYLINHDKIYEVTLKLGEKRDTADSEGKVIEVKEIKPNMITTEKIEEVLKTFIGKQKQIPPIYSAIKVKGKKLYEYARNGQKVELQPRDIEIYNIEFLDKTESNVHFKVECSKGTYIRSLCEDIAEKLGTVGYMEELKRTKVGMFEIQEAVSIQELEENCNNEEYIKSKIITIEEMFKSKNSIILEEKELKQFLNGVNLTKKLQDGIYKVYNNQNTFIGLATVHKEKIKRDIIQLAESNI